MANQNNIDMFNKFNNVIDTLYFCTEREEIDCVFSKADITDFKARITLLDRCMGISKTYSTPEDLTDEDEYDFECAVFVEGTWRMLS